MTAKPETRSIVAKPFGHKAWIGARVYTKHLECAFEPVSFDAAQAHAVLVDKPVSVVCATPSGDATYNPGAPFPWSYHRSPNANGKSYKFYLVLRELPSREVLAERANFEYLLKHQPLEAARLLDLAAIDAVCIDIQRGTLWPWQRAISKNARLGAAYGMGIPKLSSLAGEHALALWGLSRPVFTSFDPATNAITITPVEDDHDPR